VFDRATWTFINSFADWFSALGTIAAVVVALYLARKDARIRLRVRAGIRTMLQAGSKARPEFLMLEATNIGRRPAQIVNIGMRDGIRIRVSPRHRLGVLMVVMPPNDPLSATVPTTITDGQSASYYFPWPQFLKINREAIRTCFGGRLGWPRARLFQFGVETSAGGGFYVRIEKGLARKLVEDARER
jgi:hypothetical protein